MGWPHVRLDPEGPPRGVPVFDTGSCNACGDCIDACPAGCIRLPGGAGLPVVDAGACVRCGQCVSACGEAAVTLGGRRDLAVYSREDLVMDGGPPAERPVGRPPSRLYRRAVDGKGAGGIGPEDLLEERRRSMGRG